MGDRSKDVTTASTATLPATAARALDFDALYRDARDDVFAYTATLLRDSAAAEDVTAQAFERAYKRRSRFDARRGTPRAWLFGIARNAALDELRRRKRVATAELPAPPQRARPGRGGRAGRRARRRPAALGKLGARDRELIALKYHADLSNAEIAEVARRQRTNAGTLLHRAMNKLREASMPDLEMLLRDVRPVPDPELGRAPGQAGRRRVSRPALALEEAAARAARPLRRVRWPRRRPPRCCVIVVVGIAAAAERRLRRARRRRQRAAPRRAEAEAQPPESSRGSAGAATAAPHRDAGAAPADAGGATARCSRTPRSRSRPAREVQARRRPRDPRRRHARRLRRRARRRRRLARAPPTLTLKIPSAKLDTRSPSSPSSRTSARARSRPRT